MIVFNVHKDFIVMWLDRQWLNCKDWDLPAMVNAQLDMFVQEDLPQQLQQAQWDIFVLLATTVQLVQKAKLNALQELIKI